MRRDDGSIRSANDPVWDNMYLIRDHKLYRGVIREVIYTDDERNNSGGNSDPNEVVYNLMVIGGDRDGQLFNNARLMRSLGGFSNFDEIVLKATEGLTKADPTSLLGQTDPSLRNIPKFNGDVVYFQFLNGDLHLPVITGLGYHQAADAEASSDDGQRKRKQFNGIYTEITKDGEFTWSKDNGALVPTAPNPDNPLYPYVNQFAPFPGQDGAVVITLGNKFDFEFAYNTGLSLAIDGVDDIFDFQTAAGAGYTIDGLGDSHEFTTTMGTGLKITGTSDSLELSSSAGAAVKIDGAEDSVTLTTTSGTEVSLSADGGFSAKDALGDSLELNQGAVNLKNASGAALTMAQTGFIEFGNSGGKLFADIIIPLLQSMSTASYSGFGAPGSNVADFIQLLAKAMLMAGG